VLLDHFYPTTSPVAGGFLISNLVHLDFKVITLVELLRGVPALLLRVLDLVFALVLLLLLL
jgi:hypothetical protein